MVRCGATHSSAQRDNMAALSRYGDAVFHENTRLKKENERLNEQIKDLEACIGFLDPEEVVFKCEQCKHWTRNGTYCDDEVGGCGNEILCEDCVPVCKKCLANKVGDESDDENSSQKSQEEYVFKCESCGDCSVVGREEYDDFCCGELRECEKCLANKVGDEESDDEKSD